MNTSTTAEIPTNFWGQIEHQLTMIITEPAETFDAVRRVLLDPDYDQVQKDIHLNEPRTFDADSAFFAGSGGEESLQEALYDAGWGLVTAKASYYYAMRHPTTGETLTYLEGDVERGDRITKGGSPG